MQVVMVQFLSINFFLDFFNFCWVFQKFSFFVSLCITGVKHLDAIRENKKGYSVTYVSQFYCCQYSRSICIEEINYLEFKIIIVFVFVSLSHLGVSVIANSRKTRSSSPSTNHVKVSCK